LVSHLLDDGRHEPFEVVCTAPGGRGVGFVFDVRIGRLDIDQIRTHDQHH
jgi:hypothetical protein